MLAPEKLDIFRQIYDESVDYDVEVSGLVYYANGVWRIYSIYYGEEHTVPVPEISVDIDTPGLTVVVRYHTHLPHGGQVTMPPSCPDWETLNPNERALVIAREGVYKFYRDPTMDIKNSEEIDDQLRLVHRGMISIAEYHKFVTARGLRFEFYAFAK